MDKKNKNISPEVQTDPAKLPPFLNRFKNSVDKFKSKWKIALPALVVIVIITGGITYFLINSNHLKQQQKQSSSENTTQVEEPANAVFNLSDAVFAQYKEVKSMVSRPILQPYTLKSSELTNLNEVASDAKIQFNADQLGTLETKGFFTQPTHPKLSKPDTVIYPASGNRSDDMVDLYSQFGGEFADWKRKPENAVFVSTDFLIHIYHVLIDRSFQNIEEVNFQPALRQLTEALYNNAITKYNQEQDPQLKDSWKRLSVFYLVPQVLLNSSSNKPIIYFGNSAEQDKGLQDDNNADSLASVQAQLQQYQNTTPTEIYQSASQKLNLIMEAKAFSPEEDYTQYTPRSHYTKNSVLRSYFRAMMWYGRQAFKVDNLDSTRDAMLITWQLGSTKVTGKTALAVWEQIYLPTVFFVGRSDDLTIYEYSNLMTKIYGSSVDYGALADPAKLQQFQSEAQKLQGPKILSEVITLNPNDPPTKEELLQSTKGFRFMGQRFIPDSYMFSSLTQGDEKADSETGQKLPSTPTALMIMSILGSNTADSLLNDWISTNAPQSDKVIAKVKNQLKDEFQKYDEKTWTQNVYWSWLYNLRPLFDDHNDGYPMFMRGLPWSQKSLVSVLGSWTELRHDTLLYAKQSYAEMGGGGGEPPKPPPVPKGYVEPNLSFITRLIALTTMTRDGLNSKGLLESRQKSKFDSFLNSLQFFKSIAEKELSDSIIPDADYEKLRTIVRSSYPSIVWKPDGSLMTEQDARAGIIADVHTDAKKGQVLYEATGAPAIIYVAVKDKNGTRLTRGVTYSYYEFTQPIGKRLTDQDWQGMIYEGKNTNNIPPQPNWIDFVKP